MAQFIYNKLVICGSKILVAKLVPESAPALEDLCFRDVGSLSYFKRTIFMCLLTRCARQEL